MRGRSILIAVILWLSSSLWTVASDDAELPIYFAGLRQQGLFSVAEEYALSRLAEPELDPAQQAILAVELSRVFASHAVEATSDAESTELWTRAEESITPLLGQRDTPRWVMVRARQATLLCDRSLWEYWKSVLDPESDLQRMAALNSTRAALASLHSSVIEIKESNQSASRVTAKSQERLTAKSSTPARPMAAGVTASELRRIGDEIEYLIIRMNVNLAQLQPVGADRAAALIDADKRSATLSRRVNSDFVWPARLARAETLRLQVDPENSVAYVRSLLATEPTPEMSDALIAEQARTQLVLQAPADAIQLILEHGKARGQLTSELRAVAIEGLLASINDTQIKGDTALAEDLWVQATAQQQLISGPWRTYADALLSRVGETRKYGDQLAAIVRTGRLAAQGRDWVTASAAYQQAVMQATTDGQIPYAAEFAFTQASIEIEAGHFEQASQIFAEYHTRFPGDPRAADAHLLAAWTLGKLHDQKPSSARRADYVAQLKDHCTSFPDHPTRIEAEWSLAVDAIRHQEWISAIEFMEIIPTDYARATEVAAQLPYCFEMALAEFGQNPSRSVWVQRAQSSLATQQATWPLPPAAWSLSQSENALRWARVLLHLPDHHYSAVDSLLVQILHSRDVEVREVARDHSPLDPAWDQLVPAVTQLRIISLAGMGRTADAEKLLSSATTASPQDILMILSGLSAMAVSLDEKSRHDLGRVQLSAARRLDSQRAQLTPDVAANVDRCLAEAYTATGDLPEAVALYETLLKSQPRDRQLLETIGGLLQQHGQPKDLQRAKLIHRQLEGFDPAGSPAWLRTRLIVARLCLQLGEKTECQKLLKVTRILYPELGGVELKAEYAKLEMSL